MSIDKLILSYNENRMNYASELLKSSDYAVIYICLSCGCNNLSYFYHLYKKYYEFYPKKYVKKLHLINILIYMMSKLSKVITRIIST